MLAKHTKQRAPRPPFSANTAMDYKLPTAAEGRWQAAATHLLLQLHYLRVDAGERCSVIDVCCSRVQRCFEAFANMRLQSQPNRHHMNFRDAHAVCCALTQACNRKWAVQDGRATTPRNVKLTLTQRSCSSCATA